MLKVLFWPKDIASHYLFMKLSFILELPEAPFHSRISHYYISQGIYQEARSLIVYTHILYIYIYISVYTFGAITFSITYSDSICSVIFALQLCAIYSASLRNIQRFIAQFTALHCAIHRASLRNIQSFIAQYTELHCAIHRASLRNTKSFIAQFTELHCAIHSFLPLSQCQIEACNNLKLFILSRIKARNIEK